GGDGITYHKWQITPAAAGATGPPLPPPSERPPRDPSRLVNRPEVRRELAYGPTDRRGHTPDAVIIAPAEYDGAVSVTAQKNRGEHRPQGQRRGVAPTPRLRSCTALGAKIRAISDDDARRCRAVT